MIELRRVVATTTLLGLATPLSFPHRTAQTLARSKNKLDQAQLSGDVLGMPGDNESFFYPALEMDLGPHGYRVHPVLALFFRELVDHDPRSIAAPATIASAEVQVPTQMGGARRDRQPLGLAVLGALIKFKAAHGWCPPHSPPLAGGAIAEIDPLHNTPQVHSQVGASDG
jgi:hypothetical protein